MTTAGKQYNDESDRFILIDVRAWDSMDLYETRIYGHIKRRAGETSSCWESIKNIVVHTGVKRTKLLEVISSLIKKRLIRKEKGKLGSTDSYFITHPKDWKLPLVPSAKRTPPRPRND